MANEGLEFPQNLPLEEELERIARHVPAIPANYRELRNLLALLRNPERADSQEGRGGEGPSPAGGSLNIPTLLGPAPSQQPAASIGSAAVSPGTRNLLLDSSLNSVPDQPVSLLTPTVWGVALDWDAKATLTNMDICEIRRSATDALPLTNPLISATMGLRFRQSAASGSMTVAMRSFLDPPEYSATVLPWLVFSIHAYISDAFAQDLSSFSSATVQLLIRDTTDTTTLASSPILNMKTLGIGKYQRLWASLASSYWNTNRVIAKIVISTVTSATATDANVFDFANPMLSLSATQEPGPYWPTPVSGKLQGFGYPGDQSIILSYQVAFETWQRILMGSVSVGDNAGIKFGPGDAALDTRLRRTGTKAIELDDAASGPLSLRLRGDLVQILAADFAVTYGGPGGTVSGITRSGAQGAATTTINYSGAHIATVVTVRGGKTVTITPSYSGDQIISFTRAVT